MPFTHLLLALLVAIIWGVNFIFVKLGLEEIPPLLLCSIRFLLASFPAILFIKPPQAPFKITLAYGLIMFALQFGLVFLGLYLGMAPGLASLIMQVQVFFSMFFAAIFLKDIPKLPQVLGAGIAFIGIALVARHFAHDVSLAGFLCLLGAAATWGFGNLITKKNPNINMIALVVWGSLVACFPMFILSILFEGLGSISTSFHHITWHGVSSIIYIVYASTWVGYGVWNWLLSRYSVSVVVPFTLLIPIVGVITSILFMNETFEAWKVVAALLVIAGLIINFMGTKLTMRVARSEELT